MELSKRLKTVAEAVTPGNRVADIGTDHGYVPIYLVKNNICPSALAMDVNPGPLARAKEHITEEGLTEKIEVRLSDGLKELGPEEADTIVIAGMGGDLICRILNAVPDILKKGKELVLSPQSEWFKVRHLLQDFNYRINKEWFLKDEGKYYLVLRAESSLTRSAAPLEKGIDEKIHGELYYKYGTYLLEEKNPVFLNYLEKESAKKKSILASLNSQEKKRTPQTEERCRELEADIEEIQGLLKKYI